MSESDDFDQDINDLHGGFSWADAWQTVFFTFDCIALSFSLLFYLCVVRVMAKNSSKESSVIYLFIVFIFVTHLVDIGLTIEQFMSNFGYQFHSTGICQFVTFVTLGNRLLQAYAVLILLYISLSMMLLKSKKVENFVTTMAPVIALILVILELLFALPPALNIQGSSHGKYCHYSGTYGTRRITNWFFQVILPYFAPLALAIFPVIKIVLRLRQPNSTTEKERCQLQIVLTIVGGYFLFHFLYYLLWLGREIEALTLSQSAFQHLLGLHVWYITRPLFSLFNLGFHIITPLSPFIFDKDCLEEFPGPYVSKYRLQLSRCNNRQEDIVLEERRSVGAEELQEEMESDKTKDNQWTEFNNPLQSSSIDDDREYHQIPL